MVQTPRYLSQSFSFTLMSVDIWKVFLAITLIHPCNFALVNIAQNKLPLGAQMVQILLMGLAPPALIRAEVRASGGYQKTKTKPQTPQPSSHNLWFGQGRAALLLFNIDR